MISILGEIREWMEQTVSEYEFLPPVWQLVGDITAITVFTLANGITRSVHVSAVDKDGIVEISVFDGKAVVEPTYEWKFKNQLWTELTNELFTYLKEDNDV